MRLLRTPVLTILLAGTAVTTAALGQELAPEYPAACEASKVSRTDVERAHTVFISGKQFLEESNYDKAISYFKDAYGIDCSVHAILPIIATAYERKGDKGAAIRALDEYVKRAPTAPDHDVIERRIKNLTDQLAHEPQLTPPPAASAAPSPPAPTAPVASAAPLPPPVTTSAPAPPPAATPPAERPQHSTGAGPWVLVGIGGAAVIGSIALYAAGISDVSSAADACPTRVECQPDVAKKGNDGRSLEAVGGIVGGVGLAAIGAGVLWYVLSQKSEHGTTAMVTLVPGYAGLGAVGTF